MRSKPAWCMVRVATACLTLLGPATAFAGATALPADGGEPGQVYRMLHAALNAGDFEGMRAHVIQKWRDQMEAQTHGDDKTIRALTSLMQAASPRDAKVTGGTVDGDHAVLAVRGSVASGPVHGSIELVKEAGVWKVDKERWQSPESPKATPGG